MHIKLKRNEMHRQNDRLRTLCQDEIQLVDKKRERKSVKLAFSSDPSIGIAPLPLNPQILSKDLYDFGFFFESLCLRDLRIYSSRFNGSINYYRDRKELECEAVLVLKARRYSLIEVKLGEGQISGAEKHLSDIVGKIKHCNESCVDPYMIMNLPSCLIITIGTKTAYDLKSGVKVVPIGALNDYRAWNEDKAKEP